jgi:hypothetical protein
MSIIRTNKLQTVAGSTMQTVLQTKYAQKTNTWSSAVVNDVSYDVTGLSVTITPFFSTSIILITTTLWVGTDNMYNLKYRLSRNGTYPIQGDAEGGRPQATGTLNMYDADTDSGYNLGNIGGTHIDTPATTNPLTYTVQLGSYNGHTIYLNRSVNFQNQPASGYDTVPVSSIIVQEIAQ